MNVLMVTPHLPPHQAANALLPHLLGQALGRLGHGVDFLTFGQARDGDHVRFVRRGPRALRATRLPQAMEAAQTWWKARGLLARAHVVHVHSSTWMNQVAARLAARQGRPYVLTHYGTEIWHHDGRDRRFRRFNREARHVTFYSRALLDRARHHPPNIWHTWKIFFLCELVSDEQDETDHEVGDVGFFPRERLPQLSVSRVTEAQIERFFELRPQKTGVVHEFVEERRAVFLDAVGKQLRPRAHMNGIVARG